MPKGYILSAHRSEANPVKKVSYNLLAKDALEKAGGNYCDGKNRWKTDCL